MLSFFPFTLREHQLSDWKVLLLKAKKFLLRRNVFSVWSPLHKCTALNGYQGKIVTCPAQRTALSAFTAAGSEGAIAAVEHVFNKIQFHPLEEVLSGLISFNYLFSHLSGRQQGLGAAT